MRNKATPPPIREQVLDQQGVMNRTWLRWLTDMFARSTEPSEDAGVPSAPQNVTIIADDVDPAISGKELVVQWDIPEQNIYTMTGFNLEIDIDPDFPDDVILASGGGGSAAKGSVVFSLSAMIEGDNWVDKRLQIRDASGERILASSVITAVDSVKRQLTLRNALMFDGGNNLNWEVVVPSWDQVFRAFTVPVSVDVNALPRDHYRYVIRNLPLNSYYARVRAANGKGLGAWSEVAGPAVVDGLKEGDFETGWRDKVLSSINLALVAGSFSNNTPSAGYIAWSGIKLQYKSVEYTITNGNTNLKWVYWEPGTNVFTASNDLLLDPDLLCIALNSNGIALQQWQGGNVVDGSAIMDGTLAGTKFASSIKPVEIVAGLPGTPHVIGRVIYNILDGKLYRNTGVGWTAAVPATDLTGQITGTQISNGAITTPKLDAGAVTANELAANAVTAGKIAAGAVSTDELAANAVTADKIAALQISADKIAANAITTDKIDAGAITTTKIAAGAVEAINIAAGAITAEKIGAGEIVTDKITAGAITLGKIALGAVSAVREDISAWDRGYYLYDAPSSTLTMNNLWQILDLRGFVKDQYGNWPTGWPDLEEPPSGVLVPPGYRMVLIAFLGTTIGTGTFEVRPYGYQGNIVGDHVSTDGSGAKGRLMVACDQYRRIEYKGTGWSSFEIAVIGYWS